MIDMKDREQELKEKAKEIEKLKKELSERGAELLDASESLYYLITENLYVEQLERQGKALEAYNATYKNLVKAIREYNKGIGQERELHEKEMNVTAQEVAKLKGQYEKSSVEFDGCYTNETYHGRLKNKNKAFIAYIAAVKKRDAIREKYEYFAEVKFGWGLIDEDEYD